jgi:hypothetical protein
MLCYHFLCCSFCWYLIVIFLWISDVVGVVKNVSSTMSIRRKSNNESVAKRDITIADESLVFSISLLQSLACFML